MGYMSDDIMQANETDRHFGKDVILCIHGRERVQKHLPVLTMEEGMLLRLLSWLTGMSSVSGYNRKFRIEGTRSRGKSGPVKKRKENLHCRFKTWKTLS